MSHHGPGCTIAATFRHNISIDSDVALAIREVKALTGQERIALLGSWADCEHTPFTRLPLPVRRRIQTSVRSSEPIGVCVDAPASAVARLLERAAFVQDVAVYTSDTWKPQTPLVFPHGDGVFSGVPVIALAEYASHLVDTPGRDSAQRLDAMLAYLHQARESQYSTSVRAATASKKTTLALSHDLHIYKAKFFPRMVHALMNLFSEAFQRGTVLDPFSGSGTALLEASMLGLPSFGTDLDPLSALISSCKVTPFTVDRRNTRSLLGSVLADVEAEQMPLFRPRNAGSLSSSALSDELRAKLERRDKRDGTVFLPEIERDLSALLHIRDRHQSAQPGLLEVILSDAVTKKIRYRFVGVGNGRYTIEVVSQPMLERFHEKVASTLAVCDVFEWMEERLQVNFAPTGAAQGDARSLNGYSGKRNVGACITSPPYLPASSGREHYASSRSLALNVTGLSDHLDMSKFVGGTEHAGVADFDPSLLGTTGQRLIKYLMSDRDRTDPQRDAMRFERKAVPTWRYILDVEEFLKSLRLRTKAGGVCLMVVASQHVFYSHRRLQEAKKNATEDLTATEAVEYVVSGKELYGEIAERAGWSLDEEIRMELAKPATSMARPRSQDDYSESILVLSRS